VNRELYVRDSGNKEFIVHENKKLSNMLKLWLKIKCVNGDPLSVATSLNNVSAGINIYLLTFLCTLKYDIAPYLV